MTPEIELVGWESRSGTHYCLGHKPSSGDPIPLYAIEIDDERCAVCGEFLAAEAFRRGWLA